MADTVLVVVAIGFAFIAGLTAGLSLALGRGARLERKAYREGLADGVSRGRWALELGRERRAREAAEAEEQPPDG